MDCCLVLRQTVVVLAVVVLQLGSSAAQKTSIVHVSWIEASAAVPKVVALDAGYGMAATEFVPGRLDESSSRSAGDYGLPSPTVIRSVAPAVDSKSRSFQWGGAINQSLRFLAVEHAFRMYKEPTTRSELGGPFFKDYFDSLKGLGGFGDGDEFYVNYVGHPMEGAVAGFIEVQNDPRGSKMQVGDGGYWNNRLRAMAFSAVYSAQFEIGPISEASIGNVGRDRRKSLPNGGQGFVDLVITPTLGTGWLIGEDALDRYVIQKLERKTSNRFLQMMLRGLNPGRAFANMLRGKVPWHRDTRGGVWRPSRDVTAAQIPQR